MFGIKFPQKQNLKRYNSLFVVLTKYGFEDVMASSRARKLIPKNYLLKHPDTANKLSESTFERIRMVLEELGPSYVKLGQIMSNRDDMLPPDLVKELEKLQDHAPPLQNFDVEKVLSQELGIDCSQHFSSIDPKPLAAASLAQVHKAQLLNGDWVVLKIQRPNIAEVIASDISIMKEVAEAMEKYSTQVKAFQPLKLVESFEKSVNEELSFLREMDNMEHFAKDFGMMGTIMPNDKEALIELMLCFLKKDVRKLIPVLKKIALKADIPDEKKLEYDLYELVEGISNTSIRNIKLGITLKQFKNVLYENKITIPHYLYILIRALVIIEGVGLKLDPEFNITDNLQPYMAKITRKRFGLKRLFQKNLNRFQDYNALLDKLPTDINEIVDKIKDGKLVIVHEHKGLDDFRKSLKTAFNRLVYAVIIAALSIGSALLVMADMPPKISGIPLLGAIGFSLSAIIGLVILISIYRNKEE